MDEKQINYLTLEIPTKEDEMVIKAKNDILGKLDLDGMFQNMDICVDLFEITYNAVNGMENLHQTISKLQIDYKKTVQDSIVKVKSFKRITEEIPELFIEAYENLTSDDVSGVSYAIESFSDIKDKASEIKDKSKALAENFNNISSRTEKALDSIIDKNAQNYKDRDNKLKEIDEFKAKVSGLNEIKILLQEDISSLNEEYSKLDRRLEEQEKRAFTLDMASVISSGLGSAVGAIAVGMKEKNTLHLDLGNKEENSSSSVKAESSSTSLNTLKSNIVELKKEEKTLEENISNVENNIKTIDAKLEKESDEDKKANLMKEKKDFVTQKTELIKKKDTLKAKSDTYREALEAMGVGLKDVSEKLEKSSSKAEDKVRGLQDRLDSIAENRAKLKKENRENLAKLAEYTKMIETSVINKDSLETAISSLITAVGCLRKVVVYIGDMVLFWESVESFCETLASDEMMKSVSRYKDRRNYFREKRFVSLYMKNISNWIALYDVCIDYINAFENTNGRLKDTIGKADMEREEHWKQASRLAAKLGKQIELETAKLDSNVGAA